MACRGLSLACSAWNFVGIQTLSHFSSVFVLLSVLRLPLRGLALSPGRPLVSKPELMFPPLFPSTPNPRGHQVTLVILLRLSAASQHPHPTPGSSRALLVPPHVPPPRPRR